MNRPGDSLMGWRDIISTVRTLREEQLKAWLNADEIEADARREADRLIALAHRQESDARDEADAIRQKAHQEGRDAGYIAGINDSDLVNQRWLDVADKFDSKLHEILAQEQVWIMKLATALAEDVLRSTLIHTDAFERRLRELLARRAGKRCLTIEVSQAQMALLKELREGIPALEEATIKENPSLETGDLKLWFEDAAGSGGSLRADLEVPAAYLAKVLAAERVK